MDLAADYLHRAGIRLKALDVLYEGESWADVVCEAQEIVELALKGLLRASGVEPPRVHDVSDALRLERDGLPPAVQPAIDRLADASRRLRRDRELAYYGAEDLTPSGFYTRDDADMARADARFVVDTVAPAVPRIDDTKPE